MDGEDQHGLLHVLGAVDRVRNVIGFAALVAVGVAFVVLGQLAGRIVGAVLLGFCLTVAVRVLRQIRGAGG